MLSRDLGKVNYFSEDKERELLTLKTQWGYKDPRLDKGMENCDICANDVFRDSWEAAGIERRAFEAPPAMKPHSAAASASSSVNVDQEALIKTITERVMAALQGK